MASPSPPPSCPEEPPSTDARHLARAMLIDAGIIAAATIVATLVIWGR